MKFSKYLDKRKKEERRKEEEIDIQEEMCPDSTGKIRVPVSG